MVLRVYVTALSLSFIINCLRTTDDTSIAIWNKNRAVVVIALGVWMVNIGFLVHGKSERLSPPPSRRPGI